MKPNIRKLIEEANNAYTGERFLDIPEPWFEDETGALWCENGHRSKRTLRCSAGPHSEV